MNIGLYPGSFNPWHQGHEDIIHKALKIFSKVIILQANNPDKKLSDTAWNDLQSKIVALGNNVLGGAERIELRTWDGLIVDFIQHWNRGQVGEGHWIDPEITALIRGLRNGHDLQYEMNLQYWNEDLGLTVPVVYFITDRKLQHISSSSIRSIEKIRKK